MDWAIAIEGQTGPESVLMLFAERSEAEAVASEMRRGNRPSICVRPWNPARSESLPARPTPGSAERD
jgi:hypothetical protein